MRQRDIERFAKLKICKDEIKMEKEKDDRKAISSFLKELQKKLDDKPTKKKRAVRRRKK